MDDLRLASLLCTRLCHDLVGPAGAVNNGLELLGDSAVDAQDDVVELVQQSATEVVDRLKYFRAAYGVAGGSGGVRTLAEARALAHRVFARGKVALDWPDAGPDVFAEHDGLVPLTLSLVLCGSETLPRGGNVAVGFAVDDEISRLRVNATGPTVDVGEALQRGLAGDADITTVDARGVVPYYAARLADAVGARLVLATASPATLDIEAVLTRAG